MTISFVLNPESSKIRIASKARGCFFKIMPRRFPAIVAVCNPYKNKAVNLLGFQSYILVASSRFVKLGTSACIKIGFDCEDVFFRFYNKVKSFYGFFFI